MRAEYSIPVIFALIAFVVADDGGRIFTAIARRSFSLPGKNSIVTRLNTLGRTADEDYENFRIAQMAYMAAPVTLFGALYLVAFIQLSNFIALSLVVSLGIYFYTDRGLTQKCLRRVREIEDEFPAIVEMLTLSVGAGESPATALKRISARANGHLAAEFKGLVRDIEGGTSFASALDAMSQRVQSENLRRFVDALIISISRGTPLVETLAHSAHEARNRERITLMSAAGKSEISMMIPVVFLILPISILFALFPSLTNLNLFSS